MYWQYWLMISFTTCGIMDIILLTSSFWNEKNSSVEERKKGFLIWKTVKKFSIIHPFSYILNDTMTKNPYISLCRKLSVLVYLFQRQDFVDCHASLQIEWCRTYQMGNQILFQRNIKYVFLFSLPVISALKLIRWNFLWPTVWLSMVGPLLHAFVS